MKDFLSKLVFNLFKVELFVFIVLPMDVVLILLGVNTVVATVIALIYYFFLNGVPFIKFVVFIISLILVFINFSLKIFIGYILLFVILGLLIFLPWIIGIILAKKNED